jgi:hypothetical protein
MSIQIGSVDVLKEIINLHYELRRTQLLLEYVVSTSKIEIGTEKMKTIDKDVIEYLQKRFPDLGIKKHGFSEN